ncbi:TauD/TfdA family dioxygenase [Bradyrhizobium sp. USDA 10063]
MAHFVDAAVWRDAKCEIEQSGFALLRRWKPHLSTDQVLSEQKLATRFEAASRAHEIEPRAEAPLNTYSGQYGLGIFPPHTDMAHWPEPPRYIWLRCRRGYEAIITFLLDGNDLVARCGPNLLARSLVRARRPLNGRFSLMPLFQPSRAQTSSLLRWDETFIVPASDTAAEGMRAVRRVISDQRQIAFSLASPGDTLVIDNWRMLHGRSAVPEACTDRLIERLYLRSLY